MKKLLCLLAAIIAVIMILAACSGGYQDSVKAYTVEGKLNTTTVNQWKTLYLLDETNYVFIVKAVDSSDASIVTADFYMAGKYTKNENGTITIAPGYGYAKVMNGDEPMEFVVEPDADGTMDSMYLTMVGQFTTFRLKSNGKWEGIGEI